MNTSKIKLLVALFVGAISSVPTFAGHIDENPFRASLYSSDGAGNFVVKFDEFFGSDGWMWTSFGSYPNAWTPTYNIPYSVNPLIGGPGILSPLSGSPLASFAGLVDQFGVATVGFGVGQINTNNVNGPSDAAQYSVLQGFTISGFDNTATYSISVSMTDCCFVHGNGNPEFNGTLQIDPTQVVAPPGVPDGGFTILMFGASIVSLVSLRRRFLS